MAKLNEHDLELELTRELWEILEETIVNWRLEAGSPYEDEGYSPLKVEKLVNRVADSLRRVKPFHLMWHEQHGAENDDK